MDNEPVHDSSSNDYSSSEESSDEMTLDTATTFLLSVLKHARYAESLRSLNKLTDIPSLNKLLTPETYEQLTLLLAKAYQAQQELTEEEYMQKYNGVIETISFLDEVKKVNLKQLFAALSLTIEAIALRKDTNLQHITVEPMTLKQDGSLYCLELCAYLLPDNIPESFLRSAFLDSTLDSTFTYNEGDFNKAKQTLLDYHLIVEEDKGTFSVDPLVQAIIQQQHSAEQRANRVCAASAALHFLLTQKSKVFPDVNFDSTLLNPHLNEMMEQLEEVIDEDGQKASQHINDTKKMLVTIYSDLSLIEAKKGNTEGSEQHLLSALEVSKLAYGEHHVEMAALHEQLADLYNKTEKNTERLMSLQEAKKIYAESNHPNLAETLAKLGYTTIAMKEYPSAHGMFLEALPKYIQLNNPNTFKLILKMLSLEHKHKLKPGTIKRFITTLKDLSREKNSAFIKMFGVDKLIALAGTAEERMETQYAQHIFLQVLRTYVQTLNPDTFKVTRQLLNLEAKYKLKAHTLKSLKRYTKKIKHDRLFTPEQYLAFLNHIDDEGNFPLINACTNNLPGLVDFLLQEGAHVNQTRASDGNSALHIAVALGSEELIASLKINGADPDLENARGITPYRLAEAASLKVAEELEPEKRIHSLVSRHPDLKGRVTLTMLNELLGKEDPRFLEDVQARIEPYQKKPEPTVEGTLVGLDQFLKPENSAFLKEVQEQLKPYQKEPELSAEATLERLGHLLKTEGSGLLEKVQEQLKPYRKEPELSVTETQPEPEPLPTQGGTSLEEKLRADLAKMHENLTEANTDDKNFVDKVSKLLDELSQILDDPTDLDDSTDLSAPLDTDGAEPSTNAGPEPTSPPTPLPTPVPETLGRFERLTDPEDLTDISDLNLDLDALWGPIRSKSADKPTTEKVPDPTPTPVPAESSTSSTSDDLWNIGGSNAPPKAHSAAKQTPDTTPDTPPTSNVDWDIGGYSSSANTDKADATPEQPPSPTISSPPIHSSPIGAFGNPTPSSPPKSPKEKTKESPRQETKLEVEKEDKNKDGSRKDKKSSMSVKEKLAMFGQRPPPPGY